MAKQKKVRVLTRCVANHYAMSNERIVEFSDPDGVGGLISFRTHATEDGKPQVSIWLYRLSDGVIVNPSNFEEGARAAIFTGK